MMDDLSLQLSVNFPRINSSAWEVARVRGWWNVPECHHGSARFNPLAESVGPGRKDDVLRPHFRKIKMNGT